MSEQFLMLWRDEQATVEEKQAWDQLKVSQSLQDIVFLEAESTEKWEDEQARLHKEGWQLQSVGSGGFSRIVTYKRIR